MKLKRLMERGQTVVGPFMKLSDPAVVEIFGLAGFDFVIIDLEHGPNSIETAQNLVRAAELRGVTPIIRVLDNEPGQIQRALDIGAGGIEVPQINSRREAELLVDAVKFAPKGNRGLCRFVRAADYSLRDKQDYFGHANTENIIIAHIEGQDGVDNLEEILCVDLDVVFIGPYDLSQSLGVPGEIGHPKVIERIDAICKIAKAANVNLGTFADDIPTAKFYQEKGFKFIGFSVDVGILAEAASSIVNSLQK